MYRRRDRSAAPGPETKAASPDATAFGRIVSEREKSSVRAAWPAAMPVRLLAHRKRSGRSSRCRLLHAHQLEVGLALGHQAEEPADLRVHRFAKPAPAEDAVMTQTFRQQMLALVGGNVPAQRLRRFGLAV